MKTLVGQYPLKGVNAVEFSKELDIRNSFQITSLDPPFTVCLCTDSIEV
jgi:hypothetical protein